MEKTDVIENILEGDVSKSISLLIQYGEVEEKELQPKKKGSVLITAEQLKEIEEKLKFWPCVKHIQNDTVLFTPLPFHGEKLLAENKLKERSYFSAESLEPLNVETAHMWRHRVHESFWSDASFKGNKHYSINRE